MIALRCSVSRTVIACYPGSFNPPTIAHVAIADEARAQLGLRRVDLVVSRTALGKSAPPGPPLAERVAVLRTLSALRPWIDVAVSDHQLIVDISRGYDVVIMGADKWRQLLDPSWYGGSVARRDEALATLPLVAVAVRPPDPVPEAHPRAVVLALDERYATVSSTIARSSHPKLMCPEARAAGYWSPRSDG